MIFSIQVGEFLVVTTFSIYNIVFVAFSATIARMWQSCSSISRTLLVAVCPNLQPGFFTFNLTF